MNALVVKAGLLLIVGVVIVVVALAWSRGRDSRYFHLLSTAVTPVSAMLVSTEALPVARPFVWQPGASPVGWQWFQPELLDAAAGEGSLILTPVAESVWWMNQRGPMLFAQVEGDVTVTASVRVRKQSNSSVAPDMEWQFGGIILRDPRGDAWLSRENYVFNVVGHRGKSLQVETKSTRNGQSHVDAWDWGSGDAELRIERRAARFTVLARENPVAPWRELTHYDRPDLPAGLQVGLIVYAFSEGRGKFDMQAAFDALTIE